MSIRGSYNKFLSFLQRQDIPAIIRGESRELSENSSVKPTQTETTNTDSTLATFQSGNGDSLFGTLFLDRYQILRKIGEGGMGTVYEGIQIAVNRHIAIKVLREEVAFDEKLRQRFIQEAQAISRLSHPNTIVMHDFGQVKENLLFLVMEYLDGVSLEEVFKKGALPWRRSLKILRQILASLAEAHDQGVIHRDIKHSNIFLIKVGNNEDFVKVLDFGVAKFLDPLPLHTNHHLGLTLDGTIVGSPDYMSPEHIENKSLDARSDIYSVGAIGYELLSGLSLFETCHQLQSLVTHLYKMPESFKTRCPDKEIPERVEKLILQMLSKEREKRPETAYKVIEEIDDVLHGSQSITSVSAQHRKRENKKEEAPFPVTPMKKEPKSVKLKDTATKYPSRYKDEPTYVEYQSEKKISAKNIELLVWELNSYVEIRQLSLATENIRLILREEPNNKHVPIAAKKLIATVPREEFPSGEYEWLTGLSSKEIKPREEQRIVAPNGMVHIGSVEMESLYDGRISTPGLFVDKFEVTNDKYAEYLAETKNLLPAYWMGNKPPKGMGNHPVVDLRLSEARDYAKWRGCRLPTNEEWELVARSPDGRKYPWGNELDESCCNELGCDVKMTSEVDKYPKGASEVGCMDLIGNVWEWAELSGDNGPIDKDHVWVFGGSFQHKCVDSVGKIARKSVWSKKRYPFVGFRCVQDLK